jgi:UDP-glucose 4-epimerase
MSVKPVAIVTGGAGFIGSHMVDNLLSHGYRVRAVDNLSGGHEKNIAHLRSNPDFSFERADIRDLNPGNSVFGDARYVFHFAGIGDIVPSIEQPLDYLSVNVQGTAHVLECARRAKVEKFVYAASSSCRSILMR